MRYILCLLTLLWSVPAHAGPFDETRYCTTSGRPPIKRSTTTTGVFKRLHPCPSTNLPYGPCPAWVIDHVIPLASCGCDSVSNLQWLPTADALSKDRWERKTYQCPP